MVAMGMKRHRMADRPALEQYLHRVRGRLSVSPVALFEEILGEELSENLLQILVLWVVWAARVLVSYISGL